MQSHRKGDLTEAVVLAALKRRGIAVSVPFGDNERYDLVAESDGRFYRLQVKTGRFSDGCVQFHGKSSHTNATGTVYETYDGDTDYFAVYCDELEQLYLVGEQEFETDMRLRVADPEQHQPSINWAEEYEFDERWPPADDDGGAADPHQRIVQQLRERGVDVFEAADSDAPYDVLLRSGSGDLFRTVLRSGSVIDARIRFATGRSTIPDGDEVDCVVVSCDATGEQYLVERSAFDRTTSLRVSEPEQRQPSINWAADYEFDEQWPPS